MSRGRKPEPDVPPTRGPWRLLPALGLLLLAGCMEGLGNSDDPLLGGGPSIPRGNPQLGSSAGPPPAAPAPPETYEQLQYMLAIRGVTWQRLETRGDHGEWNFECTIPNRQQPGLQRHYNTTEPAATPQAAIRAVLDKIDREQNRTS